MGGKCGAERRRKDIGGGDDDNASMRQDLVVVYIFVTGGVDYTCPSGSILMNIH